MPVSRRLHRPKIETSGARQQATRQQAHRLMQQRDRLVAELTALRAAEPRSPIADKAFELVTRWWGPASWTGREQLLKAATWLVRLGKLQTRQA